MALSTFVGATIAAAEAWLLVPAVIGFGYVAGIAVSLGPTVSVAVLQWSVALLVAVGLPLPPREAATRAALVLAGGLLQGLLVACSWTVRAGTGSGSRSPTPSERWPATPATSPPARSIRPRRRTSPRRAPSRTRTRCWRTRHTWSCVDLLEQAERLRAALAALAAPDRPTSRTSAAVAGEVSAVLRLVADALAGGSRRTGGGGRCCGPRAAPLWRYRSPPAWHWTGEALLGSAAGDRVRPEPARPRSDLDRRSRSRTRGAATRVRRRRAESPGAPGQPQPDE